MGTAGRGKALDRLGTVALACDPSPQRLRQENQEFKASLGHVRPRSRWGGEKQESTGLHRHQSNLGRFLTCQCLLGGGEAEDPPGPPCSGGLAGAALLLRGILGQKLLQSRWNQEQLQGLAQGGGG